MSRETPRWTRVSNPVTPTVVTFPGGDSANAKPFTRVSNPVTPSAVTFAPLSEATRSPTPSHAPAQEWLANPEPSAVWRAFVLRLLQVVITNLDAVQRSVFDLVIFGDKSITEAAAELDLPRTTAFGCFAVALSKVRSEMWNDLYLREAIANVLNEPSSSAASAVLLTPVRQSIDSILNEHGSKA